jgi:hypothetical protein
MTAPSVTLVPECQECGRFWLPRDMERWCAVFSDAGPENRLVFWCQQCWEREFSG